MYAGVGHMDTLIVTLSIASKPLMASRHPTIKSRVALKGYLDGPLLKLASILASHSKFRRLDDGGDVVLKIC